MLDFDECFLSTCEKNYLVLVVYSTNNMTQSYWLTFLEPFLNSRDETIMVNEQFIGRIYFSLYLSVCILTCVCKRSVCSSLSRVNREFCISFIGLCLIRWGRLSPWARGSQFLTWAGNKEFYSFHCLHLSQSWGYDLYDGLPCLLFLE